MARGRKNLTLQEQLEKINNDIESTKKALQTMEQTKKDI